MLIIILNINIKHCSGFCVWKYIQPQDEKKQ